MTTTAVLGLVKDVLGAAAALLAFGTAFLVYRSKNRELKAAAAKAAVQQPPTPAISIGPPAPRAPRPRIIFRNDWIWRYRDW